MGLLFAEGMKGAGSILGRNGLTFRMVWRYWRNREEQDGFQEGQGHAYKDKEKRING